MASFQPQQNLTSAMPSYCISLNQTALIFIPESSQITQVFIRSNAEAIKEEIAFHLAQKDITVVIESLLIAQTKTTVPEEVIFEGQGYVLRGIQRPWTYGKDLRLYWGRERLQTSAHKWVFTFELN